METFILPSVLADQIIAHARAGYPEEVCGIVAGRDGAGVALYRGRNVSATPRVAYDLDAETLARQIEFEDAGLTLAAIYHSHISSPPWLRHAGQGVLSGPAEPETPSATDVERALYPESVYIICCLADPARPTLRGFRIVAGQVWEIQIVTATPWRFSNSKFDRERRHPERSSARSLGGT